MAITLNGRTKLTTDIEKALIELGGANPQHTLTDAELSNALVTAVEQLGAVKSPILEKLYSSIASRESTLPSLEELRNSQESHDLKFP